MRNIKILDIIFLTNIGRSFFNILKGLTYHRVMIRSLVLAKIKGHGYIRPKKKRRT
jgi:hypothetical protein